MPRIVVLTEDQLGFYSPVYQTVHVKYVVKKVMVCGQAYTDDILKPKIVTPRIQSIEGCLPYKLVTYRSFAVQSYMKIFLPFSDIIR